MIGISQNQAKGDWRLAPDFDRVNILHIRMSSQSFFAGILDFTGGVTTNKQGECSFRGKQRQDSKQPCVIVHEFAQ